MRTPLVLALAGLLLLPATALSQELQNLPEARFSIVPFVGGRVPFTSSTDVTLLLPTETPILYNIEEENSGAAIAGVELMLRTIGPFYLVGSVLATPPGEMTVNRNLLQDTAVSEQESALVETSAIWFGKAGVAYRLPEPDPDTRRFRPAGFITVGGAVVRQDFFDAFNVETRGPVNDWAVNVGARAVQQLGHPNVALTLAFDDYIVFWNNVERERQVNARFEELRQVVEADFSDERSHILMLAVGLAFRF